MVVFSAFKVVGLFLYHAPRVRAVSMGWGLLVPRAQLWLGKDPGKGPGSLLGFKAPLHPHPQCCPSLKLQPSPRQTFATAGLGVPGDALGKLHPFLALLAVLWGCSAALPGSREGLGRGHCNRYLICRLS